MQPVTYYMFSKNICWMDEKWATSNCGFWEALSYVWWSIHSAWVRKYLLNEKSRWYDFNFTSEEAEAQGSQGRILAVVGVDSVPEPMLSAVHTLSHLILITALQDGCQQPVWPLLSVVKILHSARSLSAGLFNSGLLVCLKGLMSFQLKAKKVAILVILCGFIVGEQMWESHEIFWNIKSSYIPSYFFNSMSIPVWHPEMSNNLYPSSSAFFSIFFFFLSFIIKMSQEITEFRTLCEMLHMYWLIVLLFQLWMVNNIIPILQMRRLRLTVVKSTFSKLHS